MLSRRGLEMDRPPGQEGDPCDFLSNVVSTVQIALLTTSFGRSGL